MIRTLLPLLAQLSAPTGKTELGIVWILLLGCGGASLIIFLWLFRVTRRSSKQLRIGVEQQLFELRQVHVEAMKRINRLDVEIIDKLRSLSTKGSEAHSMAKQIIAKIAGRMTEVEKLLNAGTLDDLVKAQEILTSPIDNSGTQYDAIKFSDTLLTLQPDQFGFALQMMSDLVETDLNRPIEGSSQSHIPTVVAIPHMDRQRKFTIRGFFKSLMGN